MITLVRFAPNFGLPDPSPFVIKTMVHLKMAGLAYDEEIVNNPGKGPKGKLPAIRDDGVLIGDSEFIRRHIERKYAVDFDKGLTGAERAVAHAFARMLEERTYWVGVYNRWIDARHAAVTRDTFFAAIPAILRRPLFAVIQSKVRKSLHGQGVGRHSQDEIYALGVADIHAVIEFLAYKPYFMGDEPTGVDATVFGFLLALVADPFASPAKDAALKAPTLVNYIERMRKRYF